MCIPCVMCGACMESGAANALDDGRCPACGEEVPPDAISCPHCYTLLARRPQQQDGDAPDRADAPAASA